MNIFQAFKQTCEAHPRKTCLKAKKGEGFESLTYAELYEKVLILRNKLAERGVRPGERIAILLNNGAYWPIAFFAGMSLQAVVVPIDIQLVSDDIKEILIHSASKLLLTEERFSVSLGEVISRTSETKALFLDRQDWGKKVKEEDSSLDKRSMFGEHKLAAIFYTSGTTQGHKAVMLTHKNLLFNFASIKKVNIFTEDDVFISLLPLHHAYPFMVTCLGPLLEGATVCYLASMLHHELFSFMKENRATIFIGVPQIFSLIEHSIMDRLKKYGFLIKMVALSLPRVFLKDLRSAFGEHIRFLVSGGAKLDPDIARNFSRWGFKIVEGYGLTETSPVVTFNSGDISKFDSVGKAIPDVEVKCVNENDGGIGEIAVRGDSVMLGYYRDLNLTKSVFQEGWFLTGDLGLIDKKGYVHITGRINEIIVLPSGKKINPEKIEAHYLKSPFIKEMCVLFARSGPEAGHLTAVIVPDEDYLRSKKYFNINFKIRWELEGYSQKLPPYQRIKGFVLTSEALPRSRLGKLIRYKIEEKYKSGAFKQEERKEAKEEKLSHFEELALQYLSKILKKEVRIDDHLELDLGLDSLGRIELLSSLQDLINVGIDDSLALELFQSRTVRELISRAKQALPESAFSGLLKRDDSIFWSQLLKEPPCEETKKRLKLHFDAFERFVALLEVLLIKFLCRTVFSVKVKGRENVPKDGPFVIISNHVTFLDAFFVLCALPFRLIMKTYFVGFGDIFGHPLIAWGVRFHRLIPIDSNINLAESLRVCRYILSKDKVLVYFPEGQRSPDDTLKEFRKGIGILAKESDAKILPLYIGGAYKVWPRSRAFPLPADVTIKIGECLDVAGLSKGEGEDVYSVIANNLREKVTKLAKPLKS